MSKITGPLNGLKVLDFSTLLPGPYATQLLADMGAQVLRVESRERPDLLRTGEPQIGSDGQLSAVHATINRNKDCITLNLKQPDAIKVIHHLLAEYDIVVEQFRPGVMTRLGLDFDSLKQINPALIYCSITGFGQTGPLKDRAGHDINFMALAGLSSYSGSKAHGPTLSGTQIADMAGGSHHAVMAILAAVIDRQQTSMGQYIDISMSDAALSLNAIAAPENLAGKQAPGMETEILNGGSFYDYYQTADGRYFAVGSVEPKFLQGLLQALGHPEWLPLLSQQPDEFKGRLKQIFLSRSYDQWQNTFADLDICVGPVLTLDEALSHPHFQARNMLVKGECEGGTIQQVASPFCFSRYPKPQSIEPGKRLGENNKEILSKAGLNKETLEELI